MQFEPSPPDIAAALDALGIEPSVELLRANSIRPEKVCWLWNGWLASGKLHILGGAPGTGKTTLSLRMGAIISRGGKWIDGTDAPAGNVLIWSSEDDAADTLVPRLIASGADLDRIYFVGSTFDHRGRRQFDPAYDLPILSRKLEEIDGARLLIIDPIVSAVASDSHKNGEVRRAMQPVVDLASKHDCAIIGITHFTKGTSGRDPVERITGSLAFGALPRIVMVAVKNRETSELLLLRAKSNIGPDGGGYKYFLELSELMEHHDILASHAVFGDSVEGSARDILSVAEESPEEEDGGSLGEAKQFLLELLKDGPVPARTVKAESNEAGLSPATVRRAKIVLKIDSKKEGNAWFWHLPGQDVVQGAQDAHHKTLSTLNTLDDDHVRIEI